MKYSAEQFVSDITKNNNKNYAFGVIQTDYVNGKPQVLFDGETTVSNKFYDYLSSYNPSPGDRVLLIRFGDTYIIMGGVS